MHVFPLSTIFSPAATHNVNGVEIRNGDLFGFFDPDDPVSGQFFNEDSFQPTAADGNANENIDALHFLDADNMILSTLTVAKLGGLEFEKGDLVQHTLSTGVTTLFFRGADHFASSDEDIDAVSVHPDGRLILSTFANATLGSGTGSLSMTDGDLVLYDPATEVATMFLSEAALFSANEDIDALSVVIPEPAGLVGVCLAGIAMFRRRGA